MPKPTLMTFDGMCAYMDQLENLEIQCALWYPTVADIKKYVMPAPTQYLPFLMWISQTAPPPDTEEKKESKKLIESILGQYIKIVEEDTNE